LSNPRAAVLVAERLCPASALTALIDMR
jgi:hypothetical protein